MTYEDTKKLLEQLKRKKYYAQKQQEELAELITSYQTLTFTPGRAPVQSSNISDPVLRTVIKIEEAQEEYAKSWGAVFAEIERVKELLADLPADERNVLEDYYLRGRTVRYIGHRMNYCKSTISNKLDSGTKKLSRLLKSGQNGQIT